MDFAVACQEVDSDVVCVSEKEIGDAHSSLGPSVMKGYVYACEWIQDPIAGDYPGHEPRPFVVSRTRALWVPEEGILFQRAVPRGPVQLDTTDSFPPSENEARVALLDTLRVPHAVIRDARRHLARMGHLQAQKEVLQKAMDRITEASISSEGRLQAALAKANLLR